MYFANDKCEENKRISIFTVDDLMESKIVLNKYVFKENSLISSSKCRTLKKNTHLNSFLIIYMHLSELFIVNPEGT